MNNNIIILTVTKEYVEDLFKDKPKIRIKNMSKTTNWS